MKISILIKNKIYKFCNEILNRSPSEIELIKLYKIYKRKSEKGVIREINIINFEQKRLSEEKKMSNKKYCDSIDINKVNNTIINLIESSNPFFCHRSRSEDSVCYKILKNETLTNNDYIKMNINCGVYPNKDMNILRDYLNEYLKVFEKLDIFCYHYVNDLNIFKFFLKDKIIGNYINCSYPNFFKDNSWLNKLNNKVVLIISPITDTLKLAYNTLQFEFKKFKEIKFYKSVQSIGNTHTHKNWTESLNIMKNEIMKLEFDIALISCGGYSGPLGLFIKEIMKKQAINMGGSLQYHFKIIGKRWKIDNGMNVLEHEIPKNYLLVENGCYW